MKTDKLFHIPQQCTNYTRQQVIVVEYLRETSYTCLEMVNVTVLGIVPSTVHTP